MAKALTKSFMVILCDPVYIDFADSICNGNHRHLDTQMRSNIYEVETNNYQCFIEIHRMNKGKNIWKGEKVSGSNTLILQ